jgi:hypothetical protein
MFRIIALALFAIGINQVNAQVDVQSIPPRASDVLCSTAKLRFKDVNTLKLPDGQHVIGMIETQYGKLEGRVDVVGGVVSEPKYYINGKPLILTPNDKIPPTLRACLARGKRASGDVSSYTRILESIVTSAEAVYRCKPWVTASGCTDWGGCCATVCCGGRCRGYCDLH